MRIVVPDNVCYCRSTQGLVSEVSTLPLSQSVPNLTIYISLLLQSSDYAKLEDETIGLRGKLEMTELHMQQLQNTGSLPDNTAQIESLLADKSQLQSKIEQVSCSPDTALLLVYMYPLIYRYGKINH